MLISTVRRALSVTAWLLVAPDVTGSDAREASTGDTVDAAPTDAAHDVTTDVASNDAREASATCVTDTDCSDTMFCTGIERCQPGASNADARGCVVASPANPCATGQTCNEAMDRCESSCASADRDGDGHRTTACGGDDCDDMDANRFPGNAEVCDIATHDEDCDAFTFGIRDGDADGEADARCCKSSPGGRGIAARIATMSARP